MLSSISWQQFATYLLLALVVYYAVVVFLFYRNDIKAILNIQTLQPATVVGAAKPLPPHEDPNHFLARSYTDAVQAYFLQAATEELGKEEILPALHRLSKQYSGLQDAALQDVLLALIVDEALTKCNITITKKELQGLWND